MTGVDPVELSAPVADVSPTLPREESELHVHWRGAINGGASEFEALLAYVEPMARRAIARTIRSRTDLSADDIMQDFRIHLYRRFRRYRDDHTLAGQVVLTARNVARWGFRRGPLEATDPLSPVMDSADPQQNRPRWSPESLAILEGVFRHGGAAHLQISFFFGAMDPGASGVGGNEAARGRAQRVVQDLAGAPLSELVEFLFVGLAQNEQDLIRIRELGRPLLLQLDRRVKGLPGRHVGQTMMEDYYGKDPADSIAKWSHRVRSRVRAAFGLSGRRPSGGKR
jgi:hypothetical protein